MKHSLLKFEYNQITKYIYVGTNMCCQGHFEKELLKKGIKADISLEEKRVDAPFGVEIFLWLPTPNHKSPTKEQLLIGINMIKNLEKTKTKVYVHCERGHGRAPTLVAAYLATTKNISVDEAFTIIKKRRPSAHPNKKQISSVRKTLPFLKKALF